MDVYGTAVTVIGQIYQVTVFIQGVVSDIKEYDQDRANIQLKLDLQLASLQFFEQRFLDPQHGLMLPGHLPVRVAKAIQDLLLKMNSVLAEYKALVATYDLGLDQSEDASSAGREKWTKSFFDRAKSKAKSLKLKGYDWSLFGKEKLLNVLAEYKEWSDSLRDLMQHFSQEAVYSFTDAAVAASVNNLGLKGTGLEAVAKRQKLASAKAPDTFQTLEGDVVEEGTRSNSFQLARWTRKGESTQIIVEYHEYDSRLKVEDLEPDEITELKEPVRDLAWLLQNATFSEGDDPSESDQPTIYSLQCQGFIDQVERERSAFIYKLPRSKTAEDATNLITLHELINKIDPTTKRPLRPSLGERFRIAHCLALTLLNVHGSRWVHKNIWSRGILLFQQSDETGIRPFAINNEAQPPGTVPKQEHILAFLGDWGYARPEQAGTDLRGDFEVEPNLYRHPDRQGKPTRQFARTHDIYALGVVLLETGLWKTVSQLMEKTIKGAQKTGKLPKPKDVRTALVWWAQTELPKEMGTGYAAAVVSCLMSKFKEGSDVDMSLDFREKVVDAVAKGRKL